MASEITREQWARIHAHAKRHVDEGMPDNDVSLLLGEIERLRAALNIDRTGLAQAIDKMRKLARSVRTRPDEGEPDAFDALRTIDEIGESALKRSGDVATAAIRGEPDAEIDDSITVTLTRDELACITKAAATYSYNRQADGKPTSIIDAVYAKLVDARPLP
jgi:hypothetical protein